MQPSTVGHGSARLSENQAAPIFTDRRCGRFRSGLFMARWLTSGANSPQLGGLRHHRSELRSALAKVRSPVSLGHLGYFAPIDDEDMVTLENLLKLRTAHSVQVTLPPRGLMMIVAGGDGRQFRVVVTQMEDHFV